MRNAHGRGRPRERVLTQEPELRYRMIFFDIEIYDGIPLKQVQLNENLSLESQWVHLSEDILCIDYCVHDKFEFSIDVGWHPGGKVTENGYFLTKVIEGPMTDGGLFYIKYSITIRQMKSDVEEAVRLIQSFKSLSKLEIDGFLIG